MYPLNLILAVSTASATLLMGFLPAKSLKSSFFARESLVALLAWVLVAFSSPTKMSHYPLFYAFLCFAAWWNFRADKILSGKMWFSVASGLGISIGVIMILNTTPRALPPGLSQLDEILLLASVYLGSGIIGLAYVCFALTQDGPIQSTPVTTILHRYAALLLVLTILRAAVILADYFVSGRTSVLSGMTDTALVLAILVLPLLAFFAQRAAQSSVRMLPVRLFAALVLFGALTEFAVRSSF